MAFEINDINASVKKYIFPVAIDVIFQKVLLFHLLQKRDKVKMKGVGPDGYVHQPIIVGKYPIYPHDNKFGKLQVSATEILGVAKYKLATFYGGIPLTREDEIRLKSTEAVLDVLKVRSEALTTSLIEEIETRLFQQIAVSEGEPLMSLQQAVDDGTVYTEYAGVPRATVNGFKSYVKDLAGGSLSYPHLLETYNQACMGAQHPTIAFAHPNIWNKVNQLIYDKQQQMVYKDDYLYQLGINNFKILQAPCVSSNFVPPGQLIFLNEEYMTLALKADSDEKGFTFEGYQRVSLATVQYANLFFDGQLFVIPRYQSKIINAT